MNPKTFLYARPYFIAGTITVLHTQNPYNQLPLSYYGISHVKTAVNAP
jgi:hypothetical protein